MTQIRPNILSSLILVQSLCKCYQQTLSQDESGGQRVKIYLTDFMSKQVYKLYVQTGLSSL